jgi:hypothetical protein
MTTDRRHRSLEIQLQLPLPSPPADSAGADQVDWRLDERTRHIGRQGVAAARALLGEADPTARGKYSGGGQGRTGRAA